MKKIFLQLLIPSFAVAVLISCKKDKEDNATKTRTELLTTSTWKFTAAVITPAFDYYGDGNSVTDIFSIMKPCEKDDYEIYKRMRYGSIMKAPLHVIRQIPRNSLIPGILLITRPSCS